VTARTNGEGHPLQKLNGETAKIIMMTFAFRYVSYFLYAVNEGQLLQENIVLLQHICILYIHTAVLLGHKIKNCLLSKLKHMNSKQIYQEIK